MEKLELREAVQKNLATRIHPQIYFWKTCMRVCFCAPKIEGRFSSAGTQSEQIYNIMEIMWCLFLAKQQGPIVQSFAAVLYQWSWYRFLLCRCYCVLKYRPTLRCLSQYHKRFVQIACADCGETPCWLLLRLSCRGISSAPKYCSGSTASRSW